MYQGSQYRVHIFSPYMMFSRPSYLTVKPSSAHVLKIYSTSLLMIPEAQVLNLFHHHIESHQKTLMTLHTHSMTLHIQLDKKIMINNFPQN